MEIYRPKLLRTLLLSVAAFFLNWFVFGVMFLRREGLSPAWSDSGVCGGVGAPAGI